MFQCAPLQSSSAGFEPASARATSAVLPSEPGAGQSSRAARRNPVYIARRSTQGSGNVARARLQQARARGRILARVSICRPARARAPCRSSSSSTGGAGGGGEEGGHRLRRAVDQLGDVKRRGANNRSSSAPPSRPSFLRSTLSSPASCV